MSSSTAPRSADQVPRPVRYNQRTDDTHHRVQTDPTEQAPDCQADQHKHRYRCVGDHMDVGRAEIMVGVVIMLMVMPVVVAMVLMRRMVLPWPSCRRSALSGVVQAVATKAEISRPPGFPLCAQSFRLLDWNRPDDGIVDRVKLALLLGSLAASFERLPGSIRNQSGKPRPGVPRRRDGERPW